MRQLIELKTPAISRQRGTERIKASFFTTILDDSHSFHCIASCFTCKYYMGGTLSQL